MKEIFVLTYMSLPLLQFYLGLLSEIVLPVDPMANLFLFPRIRDESPCGKSKNRQWKATNQAMKFMMYT